MGRVLIVEDEQGLLLLFSRLIEKMGHEVLAALNGPTALAILSEQTPDLLILDVAMPGMNGMEVLRRVDQMPHLDRLPVMILTATGPGPAPQDVKHRINAWVLKPIVASVFLDAVRNVLAD